MNKNFIFVLAMAFVLCLNCGCRMGNGTMIGAAIGGAGGGLATSIFSQNGNMSPALQTIIPLAGAALGAGAGYAYDSYQFDQLAEQQALAQAQQQQQQKVQYQQQMLQQQMQNTRLSAPCVVVLPTNNQALPARNGAELAQVLMQIQPGTTFGLMTNKKNTKAVTADMTGNGYFAVGIPEKRGQNVMLQFQKPSGQMAPMSIDQAAKML